MAGNGFALGLGLLIGSLSKSARLWLGIGGEQVEDERETLD